LIGSENIVIIFGNLLVITVFIGYYYTQQGRREKKGEGEGGGEGKKLERERFRLKIPDI